LVSLRNVGGNLSFGYLQIINFKVSSCIFRPLIVFIIGWFIIPFIRIINFGEKGGRKLLYNVGTLAVGIGAIAPGGGPDSSGLSLEQIGWIRDLMVSKKKT
jgi:hypothetical protein